MLVVISFLIFILLLFFICHCSSFTFSFRHHHLPWTIAGFLHPFNTFSPAHRRVIRDTFIFSHSVIFLLRALWFWVGSFYPQAFFTLCSFPKFLAQPTIIKASLGAGSSSSKFAELDLMLETQTQPICLFD